MCTYEDVEKAANQMVANGVTPTVDGLRKAVSGKTEIVARFFRRYKKESEKKINLLAAELVNSTVAKSIASAIESQVQSRTVLLTDRYDEQDNQINELINLLDEQSAENDEDKIKFDEIILITKQEADKQIHKSQVISSDATTALEKADSDCLNEINAFELKIVAIEDKNEALLTSTNQKLIVSEQEIKSLTDQVKLLSIDVAKNELIQSAFDKLSQEMDKLKLDYSEIQLKFVEINTKNEAFIDDLERLRSENTEHKERSKEAVKSQFSEIEAHKKLSKLQSELAKSERERESLEKSLRELKISTS